MARGTVANILEKFGRKCRKDRVDKVGDEMQWECETNSRDVVAQGIDESRYSCVVWSWGNRG